MTKVKPAMQLITDQEVLSACKTACLCITPQASHDVRKMLQEFASNRDAIVLTTISNADLSFERMFNAACVDLSLINQALDLNPDDGGAQPILNAIAALQQAIAQPVSPAMETQHGIAHTCAGFHGGFTSEHGRKPTEQEIWNHAIRSWRDLNHIAQPVQPAAIQKGGAA